MEEVSAGTRVILSTSTKITHDPKANKTGIVVRIDAVVLHRECKSIAKLAKEVNHKRRNAIVSKHCELSPDVCKGVRLSNMMVNHGSSLLRDESEFALGDPVNSSRLEDGLESVPVSGLDVLPL